MKSLKSKVYAVMEMHKELIKDIIQSYNTRPTPEQIYLSLDFHNLVESKEMETMLLFEILLIIDDERSKINA